MPLWRICYWNQEYERLDLQKSSTKNWTQKIYRHTTKFQNYKHTQTLQSVLGQEPDTVFSLVVFIGDRTFKTTMPDNVVYAGDYIRHIKKKTLPDSAIVT